MAVMKGHTLQSRWLRWCWRDAEPKKWSRKIKLVAAGIHCPCPESAFVHLLCIQFIFWWRWRRRWALGLAKRWFYWFDWVGNIQFVLIRRCLCCWWTDEWLVAIFKDASGTVHGRYKATILRWGSSKNSKRNWIQSWPAASPALSNFVSLAVHFPNVIATK